MFNTNFTDMHTRSLKAVGLSALFAGALLMSSCDTGTGAGDTNKEDSDHVDEGTLNQGHNSDNNPVATDTTDMERHYDNAEGAVHAGDGQGNSKDRSDVDNQ